MKLGYPHPDLLLGQLSARQLAGLLAFLEMEAAKKEGVREDVTESRLKAFFGRVEREQRRKNDAGQQVRRHRDPRARRA